MRLTPCITPLLAQANIDASMERHLSVRQGDRAPSISSLRSLERGDRSLSMQGSGRASSVRAAEKLGELSYYRRSIMKAIARHERLRRSGVLDSAEHNKRRWLLPTHVLAMRAFFSSRRLLTRQLNNVSNQSLACFH